MQETILDLLRDLQEQTGISLLFVTHDLGVVAELCERVVVMYAGEVIEDGRADEVFFTPQHPYTSGLLASIPRPGISNDRRLTAIPAGSRRRGVAGRLSLPRPLHPRPVGPL